MKREAVLGAAVAALVVTLPFAMEAMAAVDAQPCGEGASDGCYPWGAEGPAAGSWRHASKVRYIALGLLPTLLTLGAVLAAAFSTKSTISQRRQYLAMGLAALGLAALLL